MSVKLVASGTDPAEVLESVEEAFDLVTPSVTSGVIGPGLAGVGLGRGDCS